MHLSGITITVSGRGKTTVSVAHLSLRRLLRNLNRTLDWKIIGLHMTFLKNCLTVARQESGATQKSSNRFKSCDYELLNKLQETAAGGITEGSSRILGLRHGQAEPAVTQRARGALLTGLLRRPAHGRVRGLGFQTTHDRWTPAFLWDWAIWVRVRQRVAPDRPPVTGPGHCVSDDVSLGLSGLVAPGLRRIRCDRTAGEPEAALAPARLCPLPLANLLRILP